jgi:Uma2 family endonuclease
MSVASVDAGAFPVSVPVTEASAPPLELPWDGLKRFSVDEYHAMIKAGVFAEDENYELLEGLIVHKMTINPPHWIATGSLRDALVALRLPGFFVHSQEPVTIRSSDSTPDKDSEPEPDVALVLGTRRDYVQCSPGPERTPLVVEVADSTLSQDRTWKKRIYARAGVPVYWIVNLVDRQIEVYTRPSGPAERPDFTDCQIVPESGEVAVVIDGKEVGRLKVSEIMP